MRFGHARHNFGRVSENETGSQASEMLLGRHKRRPTKQFSFATPGEVPLVNSRL